MSTLPKILAISGSTRADSFNRKLVHIAIAGAEEAGAEVTYVDLRDLQLPLYDADFEAEHGLPPGAVRLKERMLEHHGLMIASPEYNSSITAVLKNAIDWASRQAPGEQPLAAFNGKVAVLMSASPGALGGLRGLVHLRAILSNINVLVLPEQRAISTAHEAFAEDGSLKDPKQHEAIRRLGARLSEVLRKWIA